MRDGGCRWRNDRPKWRLVELHKGVDVIVGHGEKAQVIRTVPCETIAKLNSSLVSLIECERSLLGFPSPGRRRDEGGVIGDTRKPKVLEAMLAEAEAEAGEPSSSPAKRKG